MSMFEDYLQNLVKERIPMPNSWQKSMALEVLKTQQNEFLMEKTQITSKVAERTGYTFLDKLERGYISHNSRSFEYTDDTQYLLGMFLRALKYHKDLDYLSVFNCITSEEIEAPRKRSYIPIVIGESYSIFVQATSYVKLTIENSLTNEVIKTIPFEKSANKAFIVRTDDLQINENLLEYLRLVIDTEQDINVTAVVGVYSTMPCLPVFPWSPIGSEEAVGKELSARVKNSSDLGFSVANYPSLYVSFEIDANQRSDEDFSNDSVQAAQIQKRKRYASKFIGNILGTSVSDASNKSIRRSVQLLFDTSTVSEAVKRNTTGLYNINGISGKHFPTQGV